MDRTSSVTLPADTPDFILVRSFTAPRALLWRCWMDPAYLARWFGPRGFTCPVCEIEPKAGGAFRIVIRGADGTDYPLTGTFREIVPDTRIVKEDDTSDHSEEWHDQVDPDRKGQGKRRIPMLTAIDFADVSGGTRVTIRTSFPSLRIRDSFIGNGLEAGWSSGLDKLDDLLFAVTGSDRTIRVTRLFAAPIETVFNCFSDPPNMSKWWGPNGFSTTTYSMDFREGGSWHYTMHGPDGTDYPNFVRYTSIQPNHLIAYDHGTSPDSPPLFKQEISFAEEQGKTRVSFQLTITDPAKRDGFIAFGAVEGGWQNLERLGAYLGA